MMNAFSFKSFLVRLKLLTFIALRNIWRNPVRSILTISGLAGGLIMVILYSALMEGMKLQMVQQATEISTGHIQIHRNSYIEDQDLYSTLSWTYLNAFDNKFKPINAAPHLYAAGLASTKNSSTGVLIKAVDPAREVKTSSALNHVRQGIMDLTSTSKTPEGLIIFPVMVGSQLAQNHHIKPGDELILVTQAADGSIGNAIYRVSGIFKPLDPNFDRTGVLMSIEAYQQLMYLEDGFHELVIRLDDASSLNETQDLIETFNLSFITKTAEGQDRMVVRNWQQLAPSLASMLEMSKSMVWIIGLIVVGLASLGAMNTMLMAVFERTHEFGILLSIGMKPYWILTMVLLESLFLGLFASVLGSILGVILVWYFQLNPIDFSNLMPEGFDWGGILFEPTLAMHLEPEYIYQGSILLIAVTLIASLVPSWKTVHLKPAEAL